MQRYGWRTPFVVAMISLDRLGIFESWFYSNWLRLTTKGRKGNGIVFGRDISITPGAELEIGDNVYIGPRCLFEITVNPPARVTIGTGTWFSHDCHISSFSQVAIGSKVLIGEFVSIRDTAHRYKDPNTPIMEQGDVIGRVVIEDDVWIGRGTLILGRPEGVVIGRGTVVGANSVVSHSVQPFSVVAGAPARQIHTR